MNKIELIKALLCDESIPQASEKSNTFFKVGAQYLIRTVTMIYTGRVKEIRGDEILLENAAWIADTGRWADALKSCSFNEVEPYHNEVVICKGGVLDYTIIDKLPLEQK